MFCFGGIIIESRFKYFRNYGDYEARNYVLDDRYNTNLNTIRRCAVVVGTNPWLTNVPVEVLKWKLSLINAYVDNTGALLKIKNIEFLEKTEKSSVAFFLGMTFAQVIAQELFDIRHLYHLDKKGDCRFEVTSTGKSPDLCGCSKNSNLAYLFEAKGSSTPFNGRSEYFDNGIVKTGYEQLESVSNVYFTHTNRNYFGSSLKKLVVATHPNSNSEVISQIVDPEKKGDENIVIDSDKMVFKYYFNVMSILLTQDRFIQSFKDQEFVIFNFYEYNFCIGIKKSLFEYLKPIYSEFTEESPGIFEGLYKSVNLILDDFVDKGIKIEKEFNKNSVSIGIDGIIAFDSIR